MSAPIAWSGSSCDFFVYFPTSSSRFYVFLCTTLGLGLATVFALLLGVGLSEGTLTNPAWAAANNISAGALIAEAFTPLGAFGKFCSVIIALGQISNNIPGTYSAALGFQMLGRWFLAVPRLFWTIFGVVIYTVLACVGRNNFYDIFEDFLALMGYWSIMFFVLVLEEEMLFRRRRGGYNWEAWNNQKKLPIGLAALTAFLIGWVGAVMGMYQNYFTGWSHRKRLTCSSTNIYCRTYREIGGRWCRLRITFGFWYVVRA